MDRLSNLSWEKRIEQFTNLTKGYRLSVNARRLYIIVGVIITLGILVFSGVIYHNIFCALGKVLP